MSGESPLSMMHAGRQRMAGRAPASRRRRRSLAPILAPLVIMVVLAAGWCGLWYYGAGIANRTLAGWMQREAAAGRVYTCGSEQISGFPFRIEVRCAAAAAVLGTSRPPLTVDAKDVTVTAQVYNPTLLVGDVTGPLTVAETGQSPNLIATWSQAHISISGFPPNPDSVAAILEQPHLDRVAGGVQTVLFTADSTELNGRIIAGSAGDHPVIDATLRFASASAPSVHALLAEPLQGNIEVVLRGLQDLAPKPLAARFRELQAGNGTIEIKSLHIERSDAVVVGDGTLTVNERGGLDGTIQVAVAGLETIVPLLGIDKLIDKGISRLAGTGGQPGAGLSALDQFMPGLSNVVRQGANASVIDDIKKMGQPTHIGDKPAVALPLRFNEGAIYLGMIRIGQVPPLF